MQTEAPTAAPTRSGKRRHKAATKTNPRTTNYRQLKNPFPTMDVFSADQIENMHETALRILEELGVKVLLPEAREIFKAAGAKVDEDSEMVWLGRDIVEAALASAPRSIQCRAGATHRDVTLEPGSLIFQPASGAPHATDLERGRRPGCARDFEELITLVQHFDVLHMLPPIIEAQDVPTNVRHYFTLEKQLTLSDKLPFVYARGRRQAMDSFEMLRDFRGLSDDEFAANPHCFTIINTNSPRTLDIPMAQGLIDFARFGQVPVVTPFTLMGAMAPITVAGAITLSHAECMSGIVLTQLVNSGAPVCYGTFTSNVDMRSGAPAFGTPRHFQASCAAGQLARFLGLPWRSAAGSASNVNDAQGANENQMGLWGCLLAGSTISIHTAGWLEGGLSVSYEKLVTDVEVLNMVAELCAGASAGADEIGFDNAVSEVHPSGHFFATSQTMERYNTEFYDPIVHDYTNFGTWTENGAKDASTRATTVWKDILETGNQIDLDHTKVEALKAAIAKRTQEGGAEPES
jgi:trimethylamine--corrinoid protein Co-methyltransferase